MTSVSVCTGLPPHVPSASDPGIFCLRTPRRKMALTARDAYEYTRPAGACQARGKICRGGGCGAPGTARPAGGCGNCPRPAHVISSERSESRDLFVCEAIRSLGFARDDNRSLGFARDDSVGAARPLHRETERGNLCRGRPPDVPSAVTCPQTVTRGTPGTAFPTTGNRTRIPL